MYLTLSKRFEFSASRRYYQREWSHEENQTVFGRDADAEHGVGQNYVAHLVFHGSIDPENGMVINVTKIKERVNRVIDSRFDHKYLNVDSPPFDRIIPSPENLARVLLEEVVSLFEGEPAQPVVCHLEETPWRGATAFVDGRVEAHYGMEFSAARRTFSPRLSETENKNLFGEATSPGGHGHRYLLRVTTTGTVDENSGTVGSEKSCVESIHLLHERLDHRNLNLDVPELADMPMTTECLTRYMSRYLANYMPVARVRLEETPDFFVEYHSDNLFLMGVAGGFNAAHRLDSPRLSPEENRALYGICNNPAGHGHYYRVEAAFSGDLDETSGTLFPLPALSEGLTSAVGPWDYKHFNLDTDDFDGIVATGENIISLLWPRVEKSVQGRLWRLRLWETPNNRFTLRRGINTKD